MRLNENYTFEGAADRCGQDLASFRCVSVYRISRYGVPKSFRWGRKAGNSSIEKGFFTTHKIIALNSYANTHCVASEFEPKPATPLVLALMKPLLLQQAKLTTTAISYFPDRERRKESSIQSPVKFDLLIKSPG
ncbi:hypothetical protein TNCV_557921 [Trichonephila clavipes]|nr:hypothetical protein TNCV_557921 [Trichonephila clavipes]